MTMRIAVSHINRRDSTFCPAIATLESNFEFQYDLADTSANSIGAASAVLKFVSNKSTTVKVVLGPNSSGSSTASSQILSVFGIPQISWAATNADLSNKQNYPQFFRSVSPDSLVMKVLAGFLAKLGYTEVNTVYFDADFPAGQARDFKAPAEAEHGMKVHSFSIPNSGKGGAKVSEENRIEMQNVLRAIKKKSCRVMVAFALGEEAWDLWSMANDMGMVHNHGWAWFGGDGIMGGQFAGNPERVPIFAGTIFVAPQSAGPLYGNYMDAWAEHMPTTDIPEFTSMPICSGDVLCQDHEEFTGWIPGMHDMSLVCVGYTALAYDAAVTLAIVADRLIKGTGGSPVDPDTLTAEDWLTEMKKLSDEGRAFECLSGEVSYNDKQERDMPMIFANFRPGWTGTGNPLDDFTAAPVASWTGTRGYEWKVGTQVLWPGGLNGTITTASMPPVVPTGMPPQCDAGLLYSSAKDACVPCPEGTRSAVLGRAKSRSVCMPCPPGSFQNDTKQVVCKPCPVGTFADVSGLQLCKACSPGSFQSEVGKSECSVCALGTAQPVPGRPSCERCALGSFANTTNSTSCRRCPQAEHTTSFPGAMEASECGCAAGTYQSKANRSRCLTCKTGMKCAFGADELGFDLLAQGADAAHVVVPMVQEGYFTEVIDPLSVYMCLSKGLCPGGLPGVCASGRHGIACAVCPDDETPAWDGCRKCDVKGKALSVLIPLGMLLTMPIVTYKLSNAVLSVKASVKLGCSVAASITVTTYQVLGMFSSLSVPWPSGVQSTFTVFDFFMAKPSTVSLDCLIGSAPLVQYLTRVILVFLLLGSFLLFHAGSKVVCGLWKMPAKAWDIDKTLNSMGAILQMLFIALVAQAALPFQCYSHPNKEKSIMEFAGVLCGHAEQTPLVVLALVVLLTIVSPFLVISLLAVRKAGDVVALEEEDSRSFEAALRLMVRFRFLLYRFRPDVWWWGLVILVRQTLLAFAPIVAPDDPNASVIFVTIVFVLYLIPLGVYWPWKTKELNLLDASSSALLVFTIVMVSSFTARTEASTAHEVGLWLSLGAIFTMNVAFVGYAIISLWVQGPDATFGCRYPWQPRITLWEI
eukprot:TRINITY_DN4555_c0_g2_i1.p1 TRINITY_DN4555_c0_g2~~TRINITY_DN4555_c0_g2_i1.p1  ORF type:complete len:1176 (-),score=171.27 TRINITY_DN4555_c0_g2_i1:797-4066(-)